MDREHSGAVKGLTWLVSGRLASALVSVISTAVLARLLTPRDFGIVAASFVVLALANVIFDGAFGVNLVRKKDLSRHDIGTTLAAALLLSFVLAGLVVAAAPAIERFFGFPSLTAILIVSSANIPLKAVLAVATASLQRAGGFGKMAAASLWGQIVGYIVVGVPIAMLGGSVWSLVIALTVGSLVETILAVRAARMPLRLSWHSACLNEIFGSGWLSAAYVVNWVANTGAQTVIGHSLDAVALGHYSRSWKLLDLFVAATSTPLSRVLLPLFSARLGDEAALRKSLLNVLGMVVPFYAVASVLFALQAPLIIQLALGSQWSASIPIAQILFLALVPRCAFKVSEIFAVASGKSLAAFYRQGVYAALMVGGASIGVRYGTVSVAVAASLAITIFYIASMAYAVILANAPLRSVVAVHLRAGVLAASAAAADEAVLILLHGRNLLLAHVLAGLAGVVAVTVTAVLGRHVLFYPEAVASITRMVAAKLRTARFQRVAARFRHQGV